MWNLPHGPLHADMYAYTMALAHFRADDHNTPVTYHSFIRKNPFSGSFTLVAGVADFIEWLKDFQFAEYRLEFLASLKTNAGNRLFDDAFLQMVKNTPFVATIDVMPEGSVVFPNEPIARVSGPQWQCLILEATLLNIINAQSLIATEAARCVLAAQGDPLFEGSLRRALDMGGYVPARASFIGGFSGTSNVAAAYALGIPCKGTFAHTYVVFHDTEEEGFRNYVRYMEDVVILLDTYNTIEACKKAIRICKEEGKKLLGVRLDSGDLGWLSVQVKQLLKEAGMDSTFIMASNDLNPRIVDSLKAQQARGESAINSWLVGTDIGAPKEQPALGGVYKLADVNGRPVIKVAERGTTGADSKTSIPGVFGVIRYQRETPLGMHYHSDTIMAAEMLVKLVGTPVMNDPEKVFELPTDVVSVDFDDPERPKRFKVGQAFTVPHIRVVDGGQILGVHETSLPAIQKWAKHSLSMLDRSHLRLDKPNVYVAGLEDSLYEQRRGMIRNIYLASGA